MLNIAAFLDPRFKHLNPFVAEIDCEDVVEDIITEHLLTCDQDHQDNEAVELLSLLDDDETAPATKKKKRREFFLGYWVMLLLPKLLRSLNT